MIPWIQVYSNLINHPKIYALADELNITSKDANPNAVAAGLVISLWLWAAQNAPDGNLGNCSNRAIAEAAQYKKKPDIFVDAMIKIRLIDTDKKIHDWDEHASLLMSSIAQNKENNAKRQKRYRERKQSAKSNENNATHNVTSNENNAPTLPNLTLPNLTLPNNHNNITRTNTEDCTFETPEGSPAQSAGSYFTEFWKLYPAGKGGNREEAWKEWKDNTLTVQAATQIIAGLRTWIDSDQWEEDGGRYIPNAAKFLREKRWLSPPYMGIKTQNSTEKGYPETMAYIRKLMRTDSPPSEPIDCAGGVCND